MNGVLRRLKCVGIKERNVRMGSGNVRIRERGSCLNLGRLRQWPFPFNAHQYSSPFIFNSLYISIYFIYVKKHTHTHKLVAKIIKMKKTWPANI